MTQDEIKQAQTVTIPGGVTLTSEEKTLRACVYVNPYDERAQIVARSILIKVRNACGASF